MPNRALTSINSRVAIFGHPLHPALIHFPVAALFSVLATDIAYIMTEDYFWARGSLWLAGIGAAGGVISGTAGLLDMLLVRRIRQLIIGWCHAVLAVMLLSLAALNWLLRFSTAPDAAILPWGVYLSGISVLLIAVTSFLGGQMVYEHAVGVDLHETEPDRSAG
ncbi:MAG: DUF2231 domain-containing protein [Pseudohongiellaceae bacterium]